MRLTGSLGLIGVGVVVGCGPTYVNYGRCLVDDERACVCEDGAVSVQSCGDDGYWESCDCDDVVIVAPPGHGGTPGMVGGTGGLPIAPSGGIGGTGGLATTGGLVTGGGGTPLGGTGALGGWGGSLTGGTSGVVGCLEGNYLQSDPLYGYCYGLEVIGTQERKTDETTFSELSFPYALPGTSWDDVALIGCNLNQASEGGEGSDEAWVPTGTGICVHGKGFSRIGVLGIDVASNEEMHWCANTIGCATWSEFNTECWEGGNGVAYQMQPLIQVQAMEPSASDGVDVPRTRSSGTICVTDISLL